MVKAFRPMLAYKEVPWDKLVYPVLVSPKLDGIRAEVIDGAVMSRSLKMIPNLHVQRMFSHLEGLDGELAVGPITAEDVYNITESAVMTRDGEPNVAFYVFDLILRPQDPFHKRLADLRALQSKFGSYVHLVPQTLCYTRQEIEAAEQNFLDMGFEGAIVRSPATPYKYGRGTANDQVLMKMKRFVDSEARIVGIYEAMANNNVATTSALGLTQRSSHKANKTGKGMLGGFHVVDIHHKWRFDCAPGCLTNEERTRLWQLGEDALVGKVIKYKYFPKGMKDLPRHPGFIGWRNVEIDG